jgi:putative nucleotidyltransferase with HDIG domain
LVLLSLLHWNWEILATEKTEAPAKIRLSNSDGKPIMSIRIDVNEAIFSLSDALDLVGIDEVAHGKRVGYMAFKCSEVNDAPKNKREHLFHLGLLHDCGVSSSQVHKHLVEEMQWKHDEVHAITGQKLMQRSVHLQQFSQPIRYHHSPWKQLQSITEVPAEIKSDANLVFLVDRVDALAAAHYQKDLQNQIDRIRDTIKGLSGELFSPENVSCFLRSSEADSFWLMLEPPHLGRFLVDMRNLCDVRFIEKDDVKDIAKIFARIVDAKSEFTFEHSVGVASLSRHIASSIGMPQESIDKIEIAGLLHDLGKLRIPDEILDKPGKLHKADRQMMRRHSFETYQVLREIRGFEDIALWASYHHEKPNGSGYPFKRMGDELSTEARIIAVADVFQALAQNRPYREALPVEQICSMLEQQSAEQLLDEEIVRYVNQHAVECYRHAVNIG